MTVRDKDGKDIGVVKYMTGRNEAAVKFKRHDKGAHMIFVGKDYINGTASSVTDEGSIWPRNWIDKPGWTLYTDNGAVCDLASEFTPPFRIEA